MVRPTANADPVRTFTVMVPPVARVRTLVVVPAAETTKLLRPVLTADDLRRTLGVISNHGSILPPCVASYASSRSRLDGKCPTSSVA